MYSLLLLILLLLFLLLLLQACGPLTKYKFNGLNETSFHSATYS